MNDTTQTKTTMRELLTRWAEVEPKRCRPCEDGLEVSFRHNEWCQVALDDIITLDLMWIQWSVQEAIVERGWSFELKYDPNCPDPNNPFDATVDSSTSGGWGFGNDGIVAPLLEAYLHTLETSK